MNRKVGKLFDLLGEIVRRTRYADTGRLKDILVRLQSRLDAQVKRNGFQYTRTRLISYFSHAGMFKEMTERFRILLVHQRSGKKRRSKRERDLRQPGQNGVLALSAGDNLVAAVTCSGDDLAACLNEMAKFAGILLKKNPRNTNAWKFDLDKKNEGFLSASKVQYVHERLQF